MGKANHGHVLRCSRALSTSQNRFNPCHKLFGAEWLDQIIVGALFESGNAIFFISHSREHDDRKSSLA
jgi:hypothetical protein